MTATLSRRRGAQKAYGQIHRSTMLGRPAEAEAFARAAALLTQANNSPHDRRLLSDALAFNQKLWTIMEAEVSDPSHPAPAGIKHDMMALADYMDQTMAEVVTGRGVGRLDGMIAVNASLSKGLFAAS